LRKFLFLLFLIYATNLPATTYYVATSGSDSNDCGSFSPCATINHAVGLTHPGDTVVVEPGTYVQTVTVNVSGTSSAPITIESQTHWGAVIAPTSAQESKNFGFIWNNGGSYIRIKDFWMRGSPDGTANTGIKLQSSGTGSQIFRTKINHIGNACPGGGGGILSAQNNAVIAANFIYDMGPTTPGCNLQQGIYLNDGNGQKVNNNLLVRGCCVGIQVVSGQARNFPSSQNVTNNTIVNFNADVLIVCKSTTNNPNPTCDNNQLNNNITVDSPYGFLAGVETGSTWGSNNTFLNESQFNLTHRNSWNYLGFFNSIPKPSMTTWITSNPLFVNNTHNQNGNYHLQSSSPVIDKGTKLGMPNQDFDGNSRPDVARTNPDIGAYEFH